MSLSLKAKLTALISLLVLVVVLAISALYCSALIRYALYDASSRADDLTKLVFDQSKDALNAAQVPPGIDFRNTDQVRDFLRTALNQDSRLQSLVKSNTAFLQTLEYVTITDGSDHVLFHSTPGEVGQKFPPAPPFSQLSREGRVRQLLAIYGPLEVYEVVYPIKFGQEPMDIRVG